MKPFSAATVQSLDLTRPALPLAEVPPARPESSAADLLACLLDDVACALIVVDRSRYIHFVNAAAEDILGRGRLLRRQDGQLSAGVHVRPMLNLAIASVLHESIIPQDRPSHLILEDGNGMRQAAYIRALPSHGDGRRTHALISVPLVREIRESSADAFAQMHGLTRTEQRVLVLMVNGATLKSAAAALKIATATVTTHLKHIFDKTGVRRQSDVVALFLRSLPPTMV